MRKYLLFIFIVSICKTIGYSKTVYFPANKNSSIGNTIEYFVDSNNCHDFEFIKNHPSLFKTTTSLVPNFGLLKDKSIWLHFSITNKSNYPILTLQIVQPLLNSIEFYYPKDGEYRSNLSGEDFPFSARMINEHNFVYDLKIPTDSTLDYYFHIKSSKQVVLPVFLGNKNEITNNNIFNYILYGIFFGIIIVMFFYNLFIYFTVKDSIYFYYVVYILIVGLTQTTIEGYGFEFLWPNNTFFASRAFFLFTALVNISGLEFVRKFLQTKEHIPKLDKISFLLYAIYAVSIIFTFLGRYSYVYTILQNFAGIVSLYILSLSIIMAWKGFRAAKYFLIAWTPLIIGIIIYVLKDVGVLPYNLITNYSITVGSSLEVMLLSFALADKINVYRKEKEESQAKTFRALKENERIIREQNIILEQKVEERTSELKNSNDSLNKAMIDLKEAEAQLVESEKMASLGQLTAGIAHEINNPINFVSSNVKPLNRDIQMLINIINEIETIVGEDISLEEKRNKINKLKTEIEYDYLKMEIDLLLKGISEGASRTAEIVKGLRIFSRLDESDLKYAAINEGLDSTLVVMNNQLNNIKIQKKYSNLPPLECFPGKLNQVFLNIISNGVYAIRKKFGNVDNGIITIDTDFDENFIYVCISDNGIGMEEKTKKKIFEPFFTTKDVGEGTGLGLSIAYNTIMKHNGTITVKSELGVGTEFKIKLPIIHK